MEHMAIWVCLFMRAYTYLFNLYHKSITVLLVRSLVIYGWHLYIYFSLAHGLKWMHTSCRRYKGSKLQSRFIAEVILSRYGSLHGSQSYEHDRIRGCDKRFRLSEDWLSCCDLCRQSTGIIISFKAILNSRKMDLKECYEISAWHNIFIQQLYTVLCHNVFKPCF